MDPCALSQHVAEPAEPIDRQRHGQRLSNRRIDHCRSLRGKLLIAPDRQQNVAQAASRRLRNAPIVASSTTGISNNVKPSGISNSRPVESVNNADA